MTEPKETLMLNESDKERVEEMQKSLQDFMEHAQIEKARMQVECLLNKEDQAIACAALVRTLIGMLVINIMDDMNLDEVYQRKYFDPICRRIGQYVADCVDKMKDEIVESN